jgi:FtsP/CotA-like multicopper oxidase with cupredoxin domain
MLEEMIVKDQAGEENSNGSSRMTEDSGFRRRDFLQKTMALASGLALYSMLPPFAGKALAEMASMSLCPPGHPVKEIMEIKSSGQVLKAVLKVLDESKTYVTPSGQNNTGQMRYIAGYDASLPAPPPAGKVWPFDHGVPMPGPTLRARVGDRVQITLLNHVNVKNFPGGQLDVAETGGACDQNVTEGLGNTYPGNPSFENPPNCFHGSSSMNLHFHGSHVSPSGVSDNVLLSIRPSPRGRAGVPLVNEATVAAIFAQVFKSCAGGHQPLQWNQWPPAWQTWQEKLLKAYDNSTPWQGASPPPGGPPVLPHDEQLWVQNQAEMAAHQLPQFYIGAYPSCFTLPVWNGKQESMGQAPGTHWYHAHKHGSTALNLANGMAGALIIEGDYDDVLKPFYTKQKVLVLQQIGAVLNLLRAANAAQTPDLVFVNGNHTPSIQMNPNEMQQWRIINANHQMGVPLDAPKGIKWVQTAQDGVQFNPKNYDPSDTNPPFSIPAKSKAPFGSLAPGNRIDLLVQAPSKEGTYTVTFTNSFTGKTDCLLTVEVKQDPAVRSIPNPMPFPTQAQFPKMPGFLEDLSFGDVTIKRDLHFDTQPNPARGPAFPFAPPKHTINGKQFSGKIDQTMHLGATEEWTLYNDNPKGPPHPFHIHINPFQVVEMKDPNQASGAVVHLPRPWIWWDNFAIPPGGYVKVLTKFADFTGMYVLHCHILGHEDRGMMQLVEVVTTYTPMKHK